MEGVKKMKIGYISSYENFKRTESRRLESTKTLSI